MENSALLLALDAFGGDPHAEVMCQAYDGLHDRPISRIGFNRFHETPVYFDAVYRQLSQMGQRGKTRAEIVKNYPNAGFVQPFDGMADMMTTAAKQYPLGNFNFDITALYLAPRDRP